jgi:hypothetical protein
MWYVEQRESIEKDDGLQGAPDLSRDGFAAAGGQDGGGQPLQRTPVRRISRGVAQRAFDVVQQDPRVVHVPGPQRGAAHVPLEERVAGPAQHVNGHQVALAAAHDAAVTQPVSARRWRAGGG